MFVIQQTRNAMKNIRFVMVVLALLMTNIISVKANDVGSDDALIESIRASADSLEKALNTRNYKEARETLDILFPLFKREMKLAKKQASELKKAGSKAEAKSIESTLKRKEEITDKLHAMVDSSSAGLRIKANNVKTLVNEYVQLLEGDEALLTSN